MTRINKKITKGFLNGDNIFWEGGKIELLKDEELHLIFEKNNLPDTMKYWFAWDKYNAGWIPFNDDFVIQNPGSLDLTNIYDHDESTMSYFGGRNQLVVWDLLENKERVIHSKLTCYRYGSWGNAYLSISEDNISWTVLIKEGIGCGGGGWCSTKCRRMLTFRYIRLHTDNHHTEVECNGIDMFDSPINEYPGHEYFTCTNDAGCDIHPLVHVKGNTFNMIYTNLIK